MNLKVVVAILLVVAVPVYAHAQNLRVGDAQKVVTIISSDKIKTQTYCEIMKLGEQVGQAHEKNDRKMIDELSQKIDTLEKILGPEYVALINGVQEIRENDQLRAEFLSAFGTLARLCTR
jgi:wobble nucleotide-excising tRNase